MNIDLLLTLNGEAGLISNENLIKKAAGAVLDTQTGLLTLEFVDLDYMDLNIPIEANFYDTLDQCTQIHIGAIKNGNIAQAYQVPFMFQDDPYRLEAMRNAPQNVAHPLNAFNYFVKQCVTGQPAHRSDLGDESGMGCVLGDASPQALQFAPHLAKRQAAELGPRTPAPAPRMGGPAPGGSMGGGSSGYVYKPTTKKSDQPE